MARQKNDGRGRLGGRKAGTPNKTTKEVKEWVSGLLEDGRARFESALLQVSPEDYIKTYMGLLPYVTPKMQAISLDATLEAEYKSLERLLDNAPNEFVDEIARRVRELQKKASDGK
jgi:hypothetical protein